MYVIRDKTLIKTLDILPGDEIYIDPDLQVAIRASTVYPFLAASKVNTYYCTGVTSYNGYTYLIYAPPKNLLARAVLETMNGKPIYTNVSSRMTYKIISKPPLIPIVIDRVYQTGELVPLDHTKFLSIKLKMKKYTN